MAENKKKNILTVADIAKIIEDIAPISLQESWDNSGLMIGFSDKNVSRILTCLEINEAVAEEAEEMGADMIITHHPLIFGGLKSVRDDDAEGRIIMKLISNEISVYSCHTPFDKGKGGNNDIIAERIGLSSVRNLNGDDIESATKMAANMNEADIGRIGKYKKPISYMQVIEKVADRLNISIRQLRATGDLSSEITMVGICTGAGADLMKMAMESGCQLFITGDVKYHEAQFASAHGICLLDAGHYGTEKFFASAMKNMLEKKISEKVDIRESHTELDPFKIL